VFFENAGGALSLNSVVSCSQHYAAIPEIQGRDNVASHKLVRVIAKAKQDMADFTNAPLGTFFVGESGTELLFRLIMNACLGLRRAVLSLAPHLSTRPAAALVSAGLKSPANLMFLLRTMMLPVIRPRKIMRLT
jgi:cysteine desulfurase / selenocysteine lyase